MKIFNHAQRMRIREIAYIMRELGDDCTEERLIRRGVTTLELEAYRVAATEQANVDAERIAA